MDPAAAAALLENLADRALRSEFKPVACLEAPEPVEVPRALLRADGRSIYQRHGGVRYATHAQLSVDHLGEQEDITLHRQAEPRLGLTVSASDAGPAGTLDPPDGQTSQ